MSAPATDAPQAPKWELMIVKQVLSGDSVIVREKPRGGPPAEKQINFSNVVAPKLARRPANENSSDESRDEPYAWESREFLRKRIIGEEVLCSCERSANSPREYGQILLGNDPASAINLTELMVSEGLLTVRDGSRSQSEELQKLQALQAAAKSAGKGMWSTSSSSFEHVRNIKWTQDDARSFQMKSGGKPIKAIIEHVRDGSTIRAFLLPDFNYITLMISGIRCPGYKLDQDGKPNQNITVPFLDEARFFVESRLLQRDVEIILESVNNKNYVGSILYPKGNIAESLLREGFAKCVDWSMAFVTTGAEKLRQAEQQAKENRKRLWQDYQPPTHQVVNFKEKDFNGTVTEILSGECINVKTSSGAVKKVFLSSIRPPREQAKPIDEEGEKKPVQRNKRPLYDIPWMFEAREFLRKKLIGKKVQCNLDYISPARDNFPQKCCYTVTIGQSNVAEALVQKGLATVVRYRNDDDQRSCRYDELISAEHQAAKGSKGVHAKKDIPSHRINDLTADHSRIKHQYLPSWQRALRTEAIVEFVASGSRFRLYVPKDSCLVTFLLGGISCPRSSRPALNGAPAQAGEPFGDEALAFTKEKILQRDVSIHIETTDKAGSSVIGWLWIDSVNLSVALVEEGLASVHFSADKSEYYRALKTAEETAKAQRKKIWANYVEETVEEKREDDKEEQVVERKLNHEEIVVTEITSDLHFYAQHTEKGSNLVALMVKLRQDFQMSPPLAGAYTPKRGDMCAAKFTEDNEWYRARIERIQGGNATVLYVDYGNKEIIPTSRLTSLPAGFLSDKPYASEYALALCRLPSDEDDKKEAFNSFRDDAINKNLLLNVEYRVNNVPFVTLMSPDKSYDIGKCLIADGFLHVDKRNENRLAKLLSEYKDAEENAKKERKGIWEYGNIEEDEEFGGR